MKTIIHLLSELQITHLNPMCKLVTSFHLLPSPATQVFYCTLAFPIHLDQKGSKKLNKKPHKNGNSVT